MRRENTVGMVGGLGNQLFQWGFGQWLESVTGLPTSHDLSAYRRRPGYFALDALGIDVRRRHGLALAPHPLGRAADVGVAYRRALGPGAVVCELRGVAPGLPAAGAWFYGYWQRGPWMDAAVAQVRAALAPTLAVGGATEPVVAHVRRGDMVSHGRTATAEEIEHAVATLADQGADVARVAVVTDDPDWCERVLPDRRYAVMRSGSPAQDFLTLARARHLVLSRSTFSWWAAMAAPRPAASVVTPAALVNDHGLTDPALLTVEFDGSRAAPA